MGRRSRFSDVGSQNVLLAAVLCLGGNCSRDRDVDGGPGEVSLRGKLASCTYVNPFSGSEECREYLGTAWSVPGAREDCDGRQGVLKPDEACGYENTLGRCQIDSDGDAAYDVVFPGDDAGQCEPVRTGCELFAGGSFVPSAQCDLSGETGPSPGGQVFREGPLECVDPLTGEPQGSQSGKVCTRSLISACTEPGRQFTDYGSCEPVYTQRPYWPAPADNGAPAADDDVRLVDADYMKEVAWVRSQVAACACTCCHSDVAPRGPANWSIDAGPLWVDTFYPTGLAMAAGWIDTTSLGAFPAAENNGFARDRSGLPTTDSDRMIAFFEAEVARRGYGSEDFGDVRPFGGPVYDQLIYEPSACEAGQGVTSDGTVQWTGGSARYLYVLMPGSANPGVPPNLDLPAGTLWRLDVPPDSTALLSGIEYGSTPGDAQQRFPEEGPAPALVQGDEYYLYVLADVGIPITRCLFLQP